MEGLTPLALVVFAVFKYAFYLLAARWLAYWYQARGALGAHTFAGLRTSLGLLIGLALLYAHDHFGPIPSAAEIALVLAGRLLLWWGLLVLSYDRAFQCVWKTLATAVMGVIYSTLLDLPAALVGFAARVVPIC